MVESSTQSVKRSESRTHNTRLLIVVFVGLLAAAFVITLIRQNSKPMPVLSSGESGYLFPDVQTTQITRIELENTQTGQKLFLEKIPGDWRGTDENGREVQVDLIQLPGLLQIISTLRYNRVMDELDVERFGLAESGLFVVRFEAGQEWHTLYVGEINPAGSNAYLRVASKVYLASAQEVAVLVRMVNGALP